MDEQLNRSDQRKPAAFQTHRESLVRPIQQSSGNASRKSAKLQVSGLFGRDGRYKESRPLGVGGEGIVWLAYDRSIGRSVAVKVCHCPRQGLTSLRLQEDLMARLDHPGIVKPYELGECTGTPYLAMQYVQGATLQSLMQRGLAYQRLIPIISEVAIAVAHAHARGVLHLDLKPSNIMVSEQGSPVVIDFGGARLKTSTPGDVLVASQVVGTPHYMAPEQWLGGRLDETTDVWAIGAMLLEVLSGKMFTENPIPYLSDSGKQRIRGLSLVSSPLREACERALSPQPEQRFQTVASLLDALRLAQERVATPAPHDRCAFVRVGCV